MKSKKLQASLMDKYLLKEYLRLGSINKVFQSHHYSLPISFAGYDRLLSKYEVVKSAGPNSQFSESLYVMSLLANYKVPLERIYHHHAPHSLQVSTNTLHRILHYTRLGLTRRQGAILIITTKDDTHSVLIGKDNSLGKNSIRGKKGDLTLPMGHTKTGESVHDSIKRILQNEVFSESVINGRFPNTIIPKHIKPIFNINITDICAAVYHLVLPQNPPKFSSFKLKNLKMINIDDVDYESARPGIKEVLKAFKNLKNSTASSVVPTYVSELNSKICALAQEPVE